MRPKAGIFCPNGLGDGVVFFTLPHNLQLNGWEVEIYQNTMGAMQSWFPQLKVKTYPSADALLDILGAYDMFFVVKFKEQPLLIKLIEEGKRRFPEKIKVIYAYPSKNIVNEPYYSDCLTDPDISIPENMVRFCEKVLHLPKVTKSNGFIPPPELISRKFPKRVISSRFHSTH